MARKRNLIIAASLVFSFDALGAARDIPQIGAHYPVFIVEKNENPQNIMVAYVKLDSECRFVRDPRHKKRPLFDFYWLMNRERYKPVHRLIKAGVRSRLEILSEAADRRSFDVRMNDLKELKGADPKTSRLSVMAKNSDGICAVVALMHLGNEDLRLDSIYSDASKSLWPPFRKLNWIKVSGRDVAGEEKIERRFSAR